MHVFRGLNAIPIARLRAMQSGAENGAHAEWTARVDDAIAAAVADLPGTHHAGERYDVIMVGELLTGVIERDGTIDLNAGGSIRPIGYIPVSSRNEPEARRIHLEIMLAQGGIVSPRRAERLRREARAGG